MGGIVAGTKVELLPGPSVVAEVVLHPRSMCSTAWFCCHQLLNVQCSYSQQHNPFHLLILNPFPEGFYKLQIALITQ